MLAGGVGDSLHLRRSARCKCGGVGGAVGGGGRAATVATRAAQVVPVVWGVGEARGWAAVAMRTLKDLWAVSAG